MDATSTDQDRAIIDNTIYLASLASERSIIDPIMDTVRAITARWQPDQPLGLDDRAKLAKVQDQIEDYLTKRDPLRTFTQDELEQKLAEHNSAHHTLMQRWPILSLVGILVAATAAYGLAAFLPWPLPTQSKHTLASLVFLATIQMGVVWYYLSSLKHFKPELRHAYYMMVGGVVSVGVGTLQFPVIQAFNLTTLPVFRYGGLLTFFTIAIVLMYLGVVRFARILRFKSRFINPPLAIALLVVMYTLAGGIGYLLGKEDLFFYTLSLGSTFTVPAVSLVGGVLCIQLVRHVSVEYGRALAWFGAAMFAYIFGNLVFAYFIITTPNMHGLGPPFASMAFVFAQYFSLQSGYEFKKRSNS